jgi:Ca2+-binding RTX toxin-like protein
MGYNPPKAPGASNKQGILGDEAAIENFVALDGNTFIYFDVDKNGQDLSPKSPNSINKSGIQSYALQFELDDVAIGFSGATVQRLKDTTGDIITQGGLLSNGISVPATPQTGAKANGTYLTYIITLSTEPTSTQKTITLGSSTPLQVNQSTPPYFGGGATEDYPRFYFSDLDSGVAIAGNDKGSILTGTTSRDSLNGGNGNDTLDGGLGADYMRGRNGNDTYIVDNVNDQIDDSPQTGIETVKSAVSWSLNQAVFGGPQVGFKAREIATGLDDLVLTGTDNVNGTGNYLDNKITGNKGNNTLNGYEPISTYETNPDILGFQEGLQKTEGSITIRISGRKLTSQIDTLTGKKGGDTFVLGGDIFSTPRRGPDSEKKSMVFYTEKGDRDYAVITDFRRSQGDKIQLLGDIKDYSLMTNRNFVGQGVLDTAIYHKGELIGVVQDLRGLSLSAPYFVSIQPSLPNP